MSTFVLVHGAWHGGWCWDRVAPLLRDAGHEVHAPTLTGLSERAHLLSPTVGPRPRRVGALNRGGTLTMALRSRPVVAWTALWNVTGNPAASVPTGIAEDGLPVAVQLVGRHGEETTLLALAAQLERAHGWPLLTDPAPSAD